MTTFFRCQRVSLCSQVFSLAFLTAIVGSLGARADEPHDITVNVDPGREYTSNVAAGFKVVEQEATELKIKLTTSKGTIISSELVDVAAGAKWNQVDGDPTRWKCTGVGPNDKFWCVIKCTIKPDAKPKAPGKGGGGGAPGDPEKLDRWMSVSDIDFDADSDNDSRGVHRPPSRTVPEDFDEYPGALADVPIGFVIPIDDDNEVNTTARDGGLPAMNYAADTHVLDGVIEITPKKGGTWDITPCGMYWYRQDATKLDASNRKLAIDDPNRTIPVRVKSKWNAATGTRGTGDASIVSTYTLDAAKAGHTPEDKMNYVVLGCDIDVDSNNDDTIAGANQAATGEDFLEALPSGDAQYSMYPEYANGMIVGVNDGDADKDGNPDNGWNGIGWVGPNANVVEDDAPLRPGVLRGLGIGAAAKAALELHNPFVQIKMIAGDGDVRLFSADDPKTVIGTFVNVGNTAFTFGGKSIWDRLANNDLPFLVEGLGSGEVMLACQLLLNGVVIHQDVVRITVIGIDLDILKPDGSEVAEDKDDADGWATNVNLDDDDGDGGAGGHGQTAITSDKDDANGLDDGDNDLSVRLKLHKTTSPAGTLAVYRLKFSDANLKLWKTNKKKPADAVVSEQTTWNPAVDTEVYVEGHSPHVDDAGTTVTLQLVIDGTVVTTDSVVMHIAHPIIALIGDGAGGEESLNAYANANTIDTRTDPYLVKGKDENSRTHYYSIHVYETEKLSKIALATEESYVVYDGHSNFGMGFAFTAGLKTINQFVNMSDPLCAVAWVYLREGQGHPELMFPDADYGDDPDTAEEYDPFSYTTQVAGHNGNYAAQAYSPSDPPGTKRQHLTRGANKWQDKHFDSGADPFIIIKCGHADYPTPSYRKLFLNSCSSGPYYARVFTHGTLFFAKDSCSSESTTKAWVNAIVDGNNNDEILAAINGIEDVNDYR
jgi:hypothetical protein